MTKKIFFPILFILIFVFSLALAPVLAKKPDSDSDSQSPRIFALPASAVKLSEDVFDLGSALDAKSGHLAQGYAFIHYKEKPGKDGQGEKSVKTARCFGFLATGAKWKNIEPWLVNPTASGLAGQFVLDNLGFDIGKWEDAADGKVGNNLKIDILGQGTLTSEELLADTLKPDNKNEVYFASIKDPNTIAITIVWGIFGGSASQRKLLEWDQVYNTAFSWSLSGEPGKMDFENIATHELGHSVGLSDIYTTACAEQTMFGYASAGETKKRSLETGDIAGVSTLY